MLTTATKEIAATGRFDANIDTVGPREVSTLATSFNTLLAAVRIAFDRERRFVQDASHELRTPLTSLRANSELLGHEGLSDDTRREILADMRREVDELTRLSSELASLASDQRRTEMPKPTNFIELVADVVNRARVRSGRDITFTTAGMTPGSATVLARRNQAERAVSNLLDNAVKFSRLPRQSTLSSMVQRCASSTTVREWRRTMYRTFSSDFSAPMQPVRSRARDSDWRS